MKEYFDRYRLYFSSLKNKYFSKISVNYILFFLGFLILIDIILLTRYISFAYYHSNSEFKLINAKVGNLYLEEYDYVQLIYLEETDEFGNGLNTYYLTDEIPSDGYVLTKYKCENDSTILFSNNIYSINLPIGIKESCVIYMGVKYE